MDQQELLAELQRWRRELNQQVGGIFLGGDLKRGQKALERWTDDFTQFLKQHAPAELKRFRLVKVRTRRYVRLVVPDHPIRVFRAFMDDYGRPYLDFLDYLEEGARKGRLTKPATSKRTATLRAARSNCQRRDER